jgi:hypothetical protein
MPDDSRHRNPLRSRVATGLTIVLIIAVVVSAASMLLIRQDSGPLEGRDRSPTQQDNTGTVAPDQSQGTRPAIPPRPQTQP